MTTGARFYVAVLILLAIGCSVPATNRFVDPRLNRSGNAATGDPGCEAPTLVSTGGSFPKEPKTLAIRWTGYSNFELAYNGQVILLDAYFDRGSMFSPLGFKAADVNRSNLILIGHGHLDHMSDAASVGARTGALVVGAPVTTDKLRRKPSIPNKYELSRAAAARCWNFPALKSNRS